MTLPWPPNWRNKDDYPNPATTSNRMWAWEYLRRNPEYKQLCDKIGLDQFNSYREEVEQKSGITIKSLLKIANPTKKESCFFNTDIKDKIYDRLPDVNIYFDYPDVIKIMCDEFKILVPDHYKINSPIVIFKTDIRCIRKTNKNRSRKMVYTEFENKNATRCRRDIFISLINDFHKNYSEICRDFKFDRDPGGEIHIKYLRVYDASNSQKKGLKTPDDSEVSEVVFGSKSKLSNVDKSYRAATEYIDIKKYIALAAPTGIRRK